MTVATDPFFTRNQSCRACDLHFRKRRGSTRKLVEAGLIHSAEPRPGKRPGTTSYFVSPIEVARAFGGEAVLA